MAGTQERAFAVYIDFSRLVEMEYIFSDFRVHSLVVHTLIHEDIYVGRDC